MLEALAVEAGEVQGGALQLQAGACPRDASPQVGALEGEAQRRAQLVRGWLAGLEVDDGLRAVVEGGEVVEVAVDEDGHLRGLQAGQLPSVGQAAGELHGVALDREHNDERPDDHAEGHQHEHGGPRHPVLQHGGEQAEDEAAAEEGCEDRSVGQHHLVAQEQRQKRPHQRFTQALVGGCVLAGGLSQGSTRGLRGAPLLLVAPAGGEGGELFPTSRRVLTSRRVVGPLLARALLRLGFVLAPGPVLGPVSVSGPLLRLLVLLGCGRLRSGGPELLDHLGCRGAAAGLLVEHEAQQALGLVGHGDGPRPREDAQAIA